MAEFGVHHVKAAKVSKSELPEHESVKVLTDVKSDAYDILRLIAKQHALAFAKALFRFGEARKACRKYIFSAATIRHEPDRLNNSSVWGESLFPAALVAEVAQNAANADKSLMSKWGMPPIDTKRKGKGDMGPPAKKKKHSPAFRHQPGNSPAYNPRFEGAQPPFRGGYRGQGGYRGKKNRNKGSRGSGNRSQGYQGNKRDFGGNRGGHQPGSSGHRGGRGGGRGGHQSAAGHSYPKSETSTHKKSQPKSQSNN